MRSDHQGLIATRASYGRLRSTSVVTFVALVASSAGLAWAVHIGVRDQERRLLKERTNEVGLVFTSAVSTTSSTLGTLGKVLAATDGSPAEFDRVATAEVGVGTNQLTYALMRP